MNNTKEMQEKMSELLERLDKKKKKDRVYEIEDFIREHEESEEFLAYFDTDINQKSYEKPPEPSGSGGFYGCGGRT